MAKCSHCEREVAPELGGTMCEKCEDLWQESLNIRDEQEEANGTD